MVFELYVVKANLNAVGLKLLEYVNAAAEMGLSKRFWREGDDLVADSMYWRSFNFPSIPGFLNLRKILHVAQALEERDWYKVEIEWQVVDENDGKNGVSSWNVGNLNYTLDLMEALRRAMEDIPLVNGAYPHRIANFLGRVKKDLRGFQSPDLYANKRKKVRRGKRGRGRTRGRRYSPRFGYRSRF
jgi:hypothetical protein